MAIETKPDQRNGKAHLPAALRAHAPVWHASAPPAVVKGTAWDEGTEGWAAWCRHLAKRKEPRALSRLFARGSQPLTWGLATLAAEVADNGALVKRLIALDDLLTAGRRKEVVPAVEAWLATSAAVATTESALTALTWAYHLPSLAKPLPAALWWSALDRLRHQAGDASALDAEGEPLAWQLLAGELPLALAYLFPELADCRALAPAGCAALATGWEELLDQVGLPHAEDQPWFRGWLACWARSVAMLDRHADEPEFALPAKRLSQAVLNALRWTRRDGGLLLGPTTTTDDAYDTWLPEVARVLADRPTRRLVKALLTPKAKGERLVPKKGPLPGAHSEEAESALLQTAWERQPTRLAMSYSRRQLLVELNVGKQTLLAGRWEPEVWFNGEPQVADGDWEEVCWQSDESGDYLELEVAYRGGMRLQRQLFLAREDGFLLAADVVLADQIPSEPVGQIDYRCVLPTVTGLEFRPALETREGELWDRRARARVVPLALPEWVADPRGGTLAAIAAGLELRQSVAASRALFAPLFFDLAPRHFNQPLTWRQLTVAEERVAQRPDVAVGFRATIGKEHWLVYRSMRAGMTRTVLGKHLLSQFIIGRLKDTGLIDPLVEIE